MKRFLLLALTAGLLSPAQAGIPEGKEGWMDVNENWSVDTVNVEVKGPKLRLFAVRYPIEFEEANPNASFLGKVRVNCETFNDNYNQKTMVGTYFFGTWEPIRPNSFTYEIANQLCFLTGVDGYTPEPSPPKWISTIIKNVKNKPIKKLKTGNIDCDSPVYRNRPQCFDY
mgnify:FL=1